MDEAKRCVLPVPTPPPKEGCTFQHPPIDGSLTVPELYDWHYEHNPTQPVFVYKDRERNELVHLTYRDVVPAIHRAGRRVADAAGIDLGASPPPTTVGPIAIVATSDSITYWCTVAGMLRAGVTVAPIALVNSPAAIAHLLQETSATHVIVSEDTPARKLVDTAFELIANAGARPPAVIPMLRFGDIFAQHENVDFLPQKTYDYTSPAIFVHSSGSTSLPKPIAWTHASFLQVAATPCLGSHDLRDEVFGIQGLSMAHASGLNHIAFLVSSGYTAATLPPGPPYFIPTPEIVMDSFRDTKPTFVIVVPSYLEAWSHAEEDIDVLRSLKAIGYGGAPLAKALGDSLVAKGVPVCALYGSTEAGVLGHFFPDVLGHDWLYFRINKQASVELVPAGPGIYELIAVQTSTHFLPVTNTKIGGRDGFATNDLLEKHPEKEGFWRIYGRADDQITLANGMKTNPGPIEAVLCEDPTVKAALLFGREKTHVGILIFPTEQIDTANEQCVLSYKTRIWPTIERVNARIPKHSQIFAEMVLVAFPSKPLLVTEKRTVRKGATLQQYDQEIEALYSLDQDRDPRGLSEPAAWTLADAQNFTRATICQYAPSVTSDGQDLFDHGLTSLHALRIGNTIANVLALPRAHRARNFVYRHPTIASLSAFVFSLAQGRTSPNTEEAHIHATRGARMRALVDALSADFSPAPQNGLTVDRDRDVVIVTGATGALGANVLKRLLEAEDVARVYSLNRRASDGTSLQERLRASFEQRNLDPALLCSQKLAAIEVDFATPGLGLPEDLQRAVQGTVTHILHLGWPVNFNLALESFGDALQGLKELINLALTSPTRPRFIFASSAGIFQGATAPGPILEERITDPDGIAELGYTESKWVAEQVLARASDERGLRAQVVRVGQLCGGAGGCWDTKEWVPALVRSSVFLGRVPELDGDAQWVPLDIAAAAITDARDAPQEVLHLVHPDPVPLRDVMRACADELGLPVCSYDQWLAALEEHNKDDVDDVAAGQLPALKVLDFFRTMRSGCDGIPRVHSSNATQASPALKDAPCLGGDDVKTWISYWKAAGFL
ncbi:acetyl-CoA synthetase-like protein [Phanerochaete sordida]|uniref:Acetyl-CoA synthetase-like protein n=1 Tax=Phanerochaete sordida TaxID=48140 RepID=A0A9P3GP96_9APHY|nr:acetyl-CoA synthetase-like protein [Phanerochaete sordida]